MSQLIDTHADLSLCYQSVWNVTLEHTATHFNVLGQTIFAHQGFCVYEVLAHCDTIICTSTARRPVNNESFHCCNY